VSRAFTKEDNDAPPPRYPLPSRDDPGFPLAAARALLTGANQGDTESAEEATGYLWGDARLLAPMRQILNEAIEQGNDRVEVLAERFLKAAGGSL
jgi:hypothetical protein